METSSRRPIPGFDGYSATPDGSIYSIRSGLLVRLRPHQGDGYLHVGLRVYGRKNARRCAVHLLIALTFIGPRPSPFHVVRHLDGIRTHNAVSNLRWGTKAENGADTRAHGSQRGSRNGNARLTPKDVSSIRTLHAGGASQDAIAATFKIGQSHVSRIVRREAWRNS